MCILVRRKGLGMALNETLLSLELILFAFSHNIAYLGTFMSECVAPNVKWRN